MFLLINKSGNVYSNLRCITYRASKSILHNFVHLTDADVHVFRTTYSTDTTQQEKTTSYSGRNWSADEAN